LTHVGSVGTAPHILNLGSGGVVSGQGHVATAVRGKGMNPVPLYRRLGGPQ